MRHDRALRRLVSLMLAFLLVFGELGGSGLRVFAQGDEPEEETNVSEDSGAGEAAVSEKEGGEEEALPATPTEGEEEPEPDEATNYDLWVGGMRINSDNKGAIPHLEGDGASGTYDPDTKTLTLDKVTGINGRVKMGSVVATIYSKDELNIRGNATINTPEGSVIWLDNSDDPKNLSIQGKFTFNSSKKTAVYTEGAITISGADTRLSVTGTDAWGVSGKSGITINGGTIYATAFCPMSTNGVLDFKAGELTLKTNSIGWSSALYVTGENSDIKIGKGYEILTPDGGRILKKNEGTKDQQVQIVDTKDAEASEVCIGAEAEKYDLWVGDLRITARNKDNIPNLEGSGAKGTYDPVTKTLNLTKVSGISNSYQGKDAAGHSFKSLIYTEGELSITGDAELSNENGHVIYASPKTSPAYRSLSLTGDFEFSSNSSSIYALGNVQINGEDTKLVMKTEGTYGISAKGAEGIRISAGSVKVSGSGGLIADNSIVFAGGTTELDVSNEMYTIKAKTITLGENMGVLSPEGAAPRKFEEGTANEYMSIADAGGKKVKKCTIGREPEKYDLWIGDKQVTSANMEALPNLQGGTGTYDPEKKILVLNNVTEIKGSHNNALIATEMSTDITIRGKAVLNNNGGSVVYTPGNVTLEGNMDFTSGKNAAVDCSKLTLKGDLKAKANENERYALHVSSDLIMSEGTVKLEGQNGIWSAGNIKINGGDLSIDVAGMAVSLTETKDITLSGGLAYLEPVGAHVGQNPENVYMKTILDGDEKPAKKVHVGNKEGSPLAVTQKSIMYGDTLPAPEYAKPAEGGTEVLSYSGVLKKDSSAYGPTEEPPKYPGDYTVMVCYTVDGKDYVGTASFSIFKRNVVAKLKAVDRPYREGDSHVDLEVVELQGVLDGDSVFIDLSEATGDIGGVDAGENIPVYVSGVKLSGADRFHYEMNPIMDVKVNIEKAEWTATETSYLIKETEIGHPVTWTPDSNFLAAGGKLDAVEADAARNQLDGSAVIDSGKLKFTIKAGTELGSVDTLLKISIKDAKNYKDYTLELKIVGDHKHTEEYLKHVDEVPAGCETDGCKEHYVCVLCGRLFTKSGSTFTEVLLSDLRIAPIGHDWGEWVIVKYPTETEDGLERRQCKRDPSHIEERVIPAGTDVPKPEIGLDIRIVDAAVYKDADGRDTTVYTGSAIKPAVVVKNNGKLLTEGVDYKLSYKKNTKPGTALVVVSGKGSYTKKAELPFVITKKNIADVDVLVGDLTVEIGKAAAPSLVYNGVLLKAKKDYTVSASGTTLTITGKGNFEGTRTETVIEQAADAYKASAIKVELGKNITKVYNGMPQTLSAEELKVTDASGAVLVNGTDYVVGYSANVNAGAVKVTVSGKGGHSGKVSKVFKILPDKDAVITVEGLLASYPYHKTGVKPALVVKAGGKLLTEGRDYKVTYSANKKMGTGKFQLSFLGNYKGAKYSGTTSFTIEKAKPMAANINVITGDMAFGKPGKYQPKVWVIADGRLVKNSDLNVTYSESGKLTEAKNGLSIKVSGKGSYEFVEKIVSYDVRSTKDVDVNKAKVSLTKGGKGVKKVEYTGREITFSALFSDEPQITVKIGKTVLTGAEVEQKFDIYYADNLEKGKATIVLKAKAGSGYVGACAGSFNIVSEPINRKN
ncbi:MAG: hypothetical protein K6E50_07550 [Lachnospiraceae bacterium]|nr:hypothetical protein [Lachnospiraceae bacterium]